ncbi:hypothetical protein PInf_007927 [Phytophthora infestans]|nr:hypothetical protein PInf_007927 [Phytophthora infestans]
MVTNSVVVPAETAHPYYGLLPSYVTPDTVRTERGDFLHRMQETLTCLESLCGENAQEHVIQNRHFRDIDTFFKLNHELPLELHIQLISVLVELLWTRSACAFIDVDMEVRAVKALHLLLKKWKKRPLREDPSVPLVLELWTEFGETIKDVKMNECFRSLAFFSFFVSLPTSEEPATEKAVLELLPDWLSTWSLVSRCSEWDGHWMKILSRATKRYPNTTMLDEYPSFVFAKYAMRLCVYLLRDSKDGESDGAPTRYLLEVLSLMKSFLHPSNVANVGNSLATFVYYLSNALAKRLSREKKDEKRLQLHSISKVVDAILEMCLLGIYSKNRGVATKCMYVMKILLCIDPARCSAPVMQEMLKALDPLAMSHSHLAVTAISSMAVFLPQLMWIDANDEKKTQATIQLYFHLLSWLPVVNDPAKGHFQTTKQRGELSSQLFADMENSLFAEMGALDSQLDEEMWGNGPFLEEWALAVLDRCFQFIQSRASARSASPSTDAEKGRNGKASKRDGSEDAIVLQVLNLLAILFAQLSPEIYTLGLRKTVAFVSNAFYTSYFGGKVVSMLIFNCMQGNPSDAISQFMALVLDKFHVTKSGIDVSSLMANEKVWHLRILSGLVRFSHPDDRILLRYQHELEVILAHFLSNDDDKEVYEAAGTVLRYLLFGLLGVYTHDFRSLPAAEWADATSNESGAFQYLGASISWNKLSLDRLRDARDLTVRSWTRLLEQIFQGLRGASNVLTDELVQANGALLDGAHSLLLKALGNNLELYMNFVSLKGSLMNRVHSAMVFWREEGSGSAMENQVWDLLLDIAHQLLIWRGEHLDEFKMKEAQNMYSRMTSLDVASHAYRKSRRIAKGEQVPLLSRNELVEKVMFFYAKRKVQQHFALANVIMQLESDEDTRQHYESLLTEVELLLRNPYQDVRSNAAAVMKECSLLYTRWIYFCQSRQIEELDGLRDVPQLTEEHVSGVLHMLSLPLARRNLWKRRNVLLKRVLVVLLKSNSAIVKHVDGEVSKAKIELVEENPKALFGSCMMTILKGLASKNIGADSAEEDRQAALKTLADCTSGLLHSLAKLDDADDKIITNHIADVVHVLKVILPQVSMVLVNQWVEVVYLATRPSRSGTVKMLRLEPLVNYLLFELEDSFARATVEDYARQAKWLALVEAVGVHLLAAGVSMADRAVHTLACEFGERVLQVIREHALAHQYKIIRDRAGKMLFLLGAYANSTSSRSDGSSPPPVVQSALPLGQLVAASGSTEIDTVNVDNESTKSNPENDTNLHAKETAMQWLSCCEKYGNGRDMLAVLNELLPVALLTQSHPKAEVAVQAKNVTDAVSLSLRMYFVLQDTTGENALTQLLELLKGLATSQTWKTRGAVLRFTMTFAFYHWVFFTSDLKEQVHTFICSFLTDTQREVQAMAKYALRGLLHNEQRAAVEALGVRFVESAGQAREKFPKLIRRCERLRAEGAPSEELKKAQDRLQDLEATMTESVLSLSAIVLAFPHDVPAFVPPIFEELGRFLYIKRSSNTISFLEKTVKETLLDFKRTHQDNWLETKTKFSVAQLDVIEDVAIAPSYFT